MESALRQPRDPFRHEPEPIRVEQGGLDLGMVLLAAWRERLRIAVTCVAAALITLGIAFLLPRWYRAQAVIMPPEESDLLSNMSFAQKALTKFPAFGILTDYYTPADVYKAVLLSRSVQEEVVKRFDLQRIYHQKSLEKTIKALKPHYRVKLNPDGTIAVSVEDRDARRAAQMANAFLQELDRYNIEKRNSTARRTRQFLERRVADTETLLHQAEDVLRKYQENRKAVVPVSPGAADIAAAADVMARKMALEVRLNVLRGYLKEGSEQLEQTQTELDALNNRIAALPELQTELARFTRDYKVQEQLFLLLTAELEQSRIRETMDTPTVQILDAAVPPEAHSRPRRLVLSALAGVLALMGSIAWIAWRVGRPGIER
jgi:tyrosine-protein kinase Etk/Wzc